jgi:alkylhydroperoxidase family enzyme
MSEIGFLRAPEVTKEVQRLFDEDLAEMGYIPNVSKLWAYQPSVANGLFDLITEAVASQKLTFRHRAILIAACASTLGDSYGSFSWGTGLAGVTDAHTAAGVLRGNDEQLSDEERAMAIWARKIADDPNSTSADDVQALRDAGFTDEQIFAITTFVGLWLAFSTINDALGLRPDAVLRSSAPEEVVDAIRFGRPVDDDQT